VVVAMNKVLQEQVKRLIREHQAYDMVVVPPDIYIVLKALDDIYEQLENYDQADIIQQKALNPYLNKVRKKVAQQTLAECVEILESLEKDGYFKPFDGKKLVSTSSEKQIGWKEALTQAQDKIKQMMEGKE
jgi:hypothetical protein